MDVGTYRAMRKKWAAENREAFAERLKAECEENILEITDRKLEDACRICADKHAFMYPSEYELAGMLQGDADTSFYVASVIIREFRLLWYAAFTERVGEEAEA